MILQVVAAWSLRSKRGQGRRTHQWRAPARNARKDPPVERAEIRAASFPSEDSEQNPLVTCDAESKHTTQTGQHPVSASKLMTMRPRPAPSRDHGNSFWRDVRGRGAISGSHFAHDRRTAHDVPSSARRLLQLQAQGRVPCAAGRRSTCPRETACAFADVVGTPHPALP